jgi:hypothetical protein
MINQERNKNFPIVINWLAEASNITMIKSNEALNQGDKKEGTRLFLLSGQILETVFYELKKYHRKQDELRRKSNS